MPPCHTLYAILLLTRLCQKMATIRDVARQLLMVLFTLSGGAPPRYARRRRFIDLPPPLYAARQHDAAMFTRYCFADVMLICCRRC